ncbi:hypothetical protein [Algivirga pacifica]|uniref:Lipoprotein n=1 Tax=Algivirga pacifica TaxID=1162670 RepID=A0ABP9DCT6_9BACT
MKKPLYIPIILSLLYSSSCTSPPKEEGEATENMASISQPTLPITVTTDSFTYVSAEDLIHQGYEKAEEDDVPISLQLEHIMSLKELTHKDGTPNYIFATYLLEGENTESSLDAAINLCENKLRKEAVHYFDQQIQEGVNPIAVRSNSMKLPSRSALKIKKVNEQTGEAEFLVVLYANTDSVLSAATEEERNLPTE